MSLVLFAFENNLDLRVRVSTAYRHNSDETRRELGYVMSDLTHGTFDPLQSFHLPTVIVGPMACNPKVEQEDQSKASLDGIFAQGHISTCDLR